MQLVRTEGSGVFRRIMNQPVSNQLIFSLETRPSDSSRAIFDREIVRAFVRMEIRVRTNQKSARKQRGVLEAQSTSKGTVSGTAEPCSLGEGIYV
jgi:hypothetical protein